jgi:Ni/Fe-hydrogenase subunit HybB-like protein
MNELEPIPYVTLKQSIISWTLIVMSIGINIAMIFGALRLQTYLQERNLKNGFPDGGYL